MQEALYGTLEKPDKEFAKASSWARMVTTIECIQRKVLSNKALFWPLCFKAPSRSVAMSIPKASKSDKPARHIVTPGYLR
jgi:hypothetical protein